MRAIQVSETGGPEVLEFTEVADVAPRDDSVLVDVHACGVNFIDTYHRSGAYAKALPFVPGLEGAGTVADPGSAVPGLAAGDRVAWAFTPGSYAPRVRVSPSDLYRVPDDVTLDDAAAVMLQGMTAHALMTSVGAVQPGQTVLVHAGAGGVGRLLTQFAVHRGARVIATVSSDEKAAVAREAGASDVIRYDLLGSVADGLPEAVRGLTMGDGAHVVYDGVGRATIDGSLASVRRRGMLVLFGAASGPVPPLDPQRLNHAGSITLARPSLPHFLETADERAWRSREVFEAIADGRLTVRIGGTYALADARTAHEHLESRASTGKLLLHP